MLLSSLVVGVVGTDLPGKGWFCLSVNTSFTNPGYIGDLLSIRVVVRSKISSLKVLILDGEVLNAKTKQILVRCEVKVKSLR